MNTKQLLVLGLLAISFSVFGREVEAPKNDISVTGLIEDKLFVITASDISEFHANCLSEIRGVSDGKVDELFFSANNNKYVSATSPSSYGDSQICTILEHEVKRSKFVPFQSVDVRGALKRIPFQILAANRVELLENCITAFEELQMSTTDELIFSLNGKMVKRLVSSKPWESAALACKDMILNLDPLIK